MAYKLYGDELDEILHAYAGFCYYMRVRPSIVSVTKGQAKSIGARSYRTAHRPDRYIHHGIILRADEPWAVKAWP